MNIDIIANRLARANDFVEVAIEACRLTHELYDQQQCAVTMEAPGGRPLLVVDNVARSPAQARLQTVYTLVLPLIYPAGLLGHIECGGTRPHDGGLHRELTTLATSVSVRLTELRVSPHVSPLVMKLTPRQRDVARLAAQGLSNLEIGRALTLSPNTVKKHLKDVFESLEVASRVQLAAVVGRSGPIHDYPLGVTRLDDITIVRAAS